VALERAIAEAQTARSAALDEAARLMKERDSNLLVLSDTEIFALDRRVEIAELKAQRYEMILPELINRLREARSVVRQAEVETAKLLYLKAVQAFAESAATTSRFGNDVIKFRQDLTARGFRELLDLPSIPANGSGAIIIAPDILERLHNELDRAANGVRPQPEPEIVASKAVAAVATADALAPEPVGRRLPEPAPLLILSDDDLPTNESGEVRVAILKPGIDLNGVQLSGIVTIPKSDALALLRSGAADLAGD
jgi:hypothetical protein